MHAIHLRTKGIDDLDEAAAVENSLRVTDGIEGVAAVKEIGLVSVLYDERRTTARTIIRYIRSLGFDAHLYRPRPTSSSSPCLW